VRQTAPSAPKPTARGNPLSGVELLRRGRYRGCRRRIRGPSWFRSGTRFRTEHWWCWTFGPSSCGTGAGAALDPRSGTGVGATPDEGSVGVGIKGLSVPWSVGAAPRRLITLTAVDAAGAPAAFGGSRQLSDLTETSVICFEVYPSLKTNMVPAPTQAPVLALPIGSPLKNKASWPFLISNEDLYRLNASSRSIPGDFCNSRRGASGKEGGSTTIVTTGVDRVELSFALSRNSWVSFC
jgi:hypothetical protein